MISEPPVEAAEKQSQLNPRRQLLHADEQANDQSPKIIDDISLKGISLPDFLDDDRKQASHKPDSQPSLRPEHASSHQRSKREQSNEANSISNLLNQRINLSKSTIKNQWLHDLKIAQVADDQKEGQMVQEVGEEPSESRYSSVNKDRLQQIEQEIQATRMSLLAADVKRKAIREQVLAAQDKRQKKKQGTLNRDNPSPPLQAVPQSKPMAQSFSIKFELKPTDLLEDSQSEDQRNSSRLQTESIAEKKSPNILDQQHQDNLTEPTGDQDKMQQLLQKHASAIGIDTIEESDANFEQTQKVGSQLFKKVDNSSSVDYADQENLLLIYNNGKEMSKQDQRLFKLSKNSQDATGNVGLQNEAQKQKMLAQKSTSVFLKHHRSHSTLTPMLNNGNAPLSNRQQGLLKSNQRYNQGSTTAKRQVHKTQHAPGPQTLQSARSLFSNGKDRTQSNKSPELKRPQRLVAGHDDEQQLADNGANSLNQGLCKGALSNSTLPAEVIFNTENQASRFNTIDPTGNEEALLTHGSNASSKNKQQHQSLNTARAGPTMQTLIKEHQTRTEFYKDFYHSVKSYRNFDHDKAYDEFVQRKAEDDQRKKQAVERTSSQEFRRPRQSSRGPEEVSSSLVSSCHKTQEAGAGPHTAAGSAETASKRQVPAPIVSNYLSNDVHKNTSHASAVGQGDPGRQPGPRAVLAGPPKQDREAPAETHQRKSSFHAPAKQAQPQLARRRPVPQSSVFHRPGPQTILQTYRASRRSFDFGYQGYQSVLKSKGSHLSSSKYNNSRIEEEKKMEALDEEIKKAFDGLVPPASQESTLDQSQYRQVMGLLGFVKAPSAPAVDEQAEAELVSFFSHLSDSTEQHSGTASMQALQSALPILCGLKPDPINICQKLGRLVKNRRQTEFERGVRQGLNSVSKAYEGSKFRAPQLFSAAKEQKDSKNRSHLPPSHRGLGPGFAGAKPPHQQHKTKTPDTSAHKSPQKSTDHSVQKSTLKEQPFSRASQSNEEEGSGQLTNVPRCFIEHEEVVMPENTIDRRCPEGQLPNRISVGKFDTNRYESDQHSASDLTAEQTEKQNRSEKLLEKLANNDRKPSADPYSNDSEVLKKSGQLSRIGQAAIQQDSSPARTVQIDNFGNSRTQLVDTKAQEMNFKTPTMQGLLGEQHGQKMRIDYDISQLGNALIETSLKALGSPYEPKSKKCKTEAQSQRQVDGKVAQGQPKSAQQVEAIDGQGLQVVPLTGFLRAQSTQNIDSTISGNLHSLNRQDDRSPCKDQDQDQQMDQPVGSGFASPAPSHPLQDTLTLPQPPIAHRSPHLQHGSGPAPNQEPERPPSSPPSQIIRSPNDTIKTNKLLDATDPELDNEDDTLIEDPILILDIKLVKDEPQKITVYEFDNPDDIVDQFCQKHGLDEVKRQRLLTVIRQQIQEYYAEQQEESRDMTPGDNSNTDVENTRDEAENGGGSGPFNDCQRHRGTQETISGSQDVNETGPNSPAGDDAENQEDDREDALTQIDEHVDETENTVDEDIPT